MNHETEIFKVQKKDIKPFIELMMVGNFMTTTSDEEFLKMVTYNAVIIYFFVQELSLLNPTKSFCLNQLALCS